MMQVENIKEEDIKVENMKEEEMKEEEMKVEDMQVLAETPRYSTSILQSFLPELENTLTAETALLALHAMPAPTPHLRLRPIMHSQKPE